MTTLNVTTQNSATKLQVIRVALSSVADEIHEYGLFALQQANEYGNVTYGNLLIDALGKKGDVARIEKWLMHFGKFKMKGNKLVYLARKDINAETIDNMLVKADETPWYDFTEVTHAKFSVDFLTLLKSAIKKGQKAEELQAEGKEVDVKHAELLADIKAMVERMEAPAATPAV